MEAIILVPPILVIYLALPIMTAWVAKTTGRKFWLWFFLSCVFPFITILILCLLPDVNKKDELHKPELVF